MFRLLVLDLIFLLFRKVRESEFVGWSFIVIKVIWLCLVWESIDFFGLFFLVIFL